MVVITFIKNVDKTNNVIYYVSYKINVIKSNQFHSIFKEIVFNLGKFALYEYVRCYCFSKYVFTPFTYLQYDFLGQQQKVNNIKYLYI